MPPTLPDATRIHLPLGAGTIAATVHQNGPPRPTFLNVHDDEDTSVAAGLANLAEFGGRLIELTHSGDRLIRFALAGGDEYQFDPNRMFSEAGIAATLVRHSQYTEAAHAAIRSFAAAYLERFALASEPVLIALHNTTIGPFSVASFAPGGDLAADAAAVHQASRHSPFDFFYVTEPAHFARLREQDWNVVLQDNGRVRDDGSLSVFCARRGIPYLNVEAEMGRRSVQIAMLRAVRELLGGEGPRVG